MTAEAVLMGALRQALTGEANTEGWRSLSEEQRQALYTLSKAHDMAHIVAAALRRAGVPLSPEQQKAFQKQELLAVYRGERRTFEYARVGAAFAAAGIAYVPLKGVVLCAYYPSASMRTSCDMDLLVHEEDVERAIEALLPLGYRREARNFHDVPLLSPSGVRLELHFSLAEDDPRLDGVLREAWQHAAPTGDGTAYRFSDGFSAFHLLAHMANHLLRGGCGVKSLTDWWVARQKMGLSLDSARPLLERAGLWPFATEVECLTRWCLGDGAPSDVSAALLTYILSGGVYGTHDNRIAMHKTTSDSTFFYLLQRLFLPYHTMKEAFPVLKKCPLLLPVCWGIRIGRSLSGRIGKGADEWEAARRVGKEQVDSAKALRDRLSL